MPEPTHGGETARKYIKEISDANMDDCIRSASFNADVQEAISKHCNLELRGWYGYKKLASDCSRADVNLHGFSLLFEKSALECLADACYLEKYAIQRGGKAHPMDIPAPKIEINTHPIDGIRPMQDALHIQKAIFEDCQRLTEVADQNKDYALMDVVESRFLQKETKHVKDFGDLLREVARVSKNPGHGLYHLDKDILKNKGRVPWTCHNLPESADMVLKEMACALGEPSAI
ncbi:hypothetical protein SpCBS45565_g03852 [Spizellomyces sp. 'palustris']|nr:hypothetical protein SpCBS45565_g03852 [Spizellomyces sp. 'palustris']